MRTPTEHIKTLQRRIDFLKSRPHQNSFDLAELGSLEWALINMQAKQEQGEPVAWSYWQSCLNDDGTQTAPWVHRLSQFKPHESIINKDVVPLYTTPQQRTWVGLTDEETRGCIEATIEITDPLLLDAVNAVIVDVERLLREKNT